MMKEKLLKEFSLDNFYNEIKSDNKKAELENSRKGYI